MAKEAPEERDEEREAEQSRLNTSDPAEFAGYVFDHISVFRRLAEERQLSMMTYLLEMVQLEAARVRDTEKS